MRTAIYLVYLVFFTNCFGNTPVDISCKDTGTVKGYYIVKYVKSEIEFHYKNEALREKGKTYEKMIDFDKEIYFIPIEDTISDITITIKNWNPFNLENVYFLPITAKSKAYLKKFCPEKADSILPLDLPKQSDYKFYNMFGDEKHLYKIYYLEGKEISLELENNELNKIKLDLSDEIDKDVEKFKAHFIHSINKLRCDGKMTGFTIWEYEEK